MFEKSNEYAIVRHLAVRDYLRNHEEEVFAYGELKSKLAKLYPNDIQAYSEGKNVFIQNLEERALSWYEGICL